ncbi:PadR family transcriptional regulator [Candidatus Harpocratesius sp.]
MNILENFKRSAIIAHILYHASEEPVYGAWLLQELSSHGYKISPGTLYPWLNDLKQQKILYHTTQIVEGKRRIYYSISPKGIQVFKDLKKFLKELYSELFELKKNEYKRKNQ